jgi:ABC-type branched-subunit amino acid transport system ATPase component
MAERLEHLATHYQRGGLLVEHDMDFLMRQCHRVIVLDRGTEIDKGTAAEIGEDPAARSPENCGGALCLGLSTHRVAPDHSP